MKFPEEHRWRNAPHGYNSNPGDPFGAFRIPGPHGRLLFVIASDYEDDFENADFDEDN